MKTILVTGGAGYIGSHTVKELIDKKYHVVVLDSLENGHKQAVDRKAILEVIDSADMAAVKNLFSKHQIEAVIDFAAYLAVGESMEQPEKYLKNNVLNFINLLEAMKLAKVKYIIKSSTAAAYGNPIKAGDVPWKETFTEDYKPINSALLEGKWGNQKTRGEEFFSKFINAYYTSIANNTSLKLDNDEIAKLRIPMSIYGLSKLLDEVILNKYNEDCGIKSVALRYFNVCGAHPNGTLGDDKPKPTNLMTVAMLQALGKIPQVQIFGRDYDTPDGTGIRDYIHPCDLATGHIAALEYILSGGGSNVFNLGTGKGSSVLEVIKATEDASGKKIATADAPRRSGDPSLSIADPAKAKKILGWHAKYNLSDMAKTAWNWHSKNPNGFEQ